MGFVSELADLAKKLNCVRVVNEWEQGLYVHFGRIRERRIPDESIKPRELEEIVKEEQKVIEELGGEDSYKPFLRPKLPQGYYQDFVSGRPLHPKRFSRILPPGMHFYLPFIDQIIVDSMQERVLNLKTILVPVSGESGSTETRLLSANIRYKVDDLYLAVTAVHDYEESLKDHALSILAKQSMCLPAAFWTEGRSEEEGESKNLRKLSKEVAKELEKVVKKRWGLDILEVYITDNALVTVYRQFHDGATGDTFIKVPE